MRPEDDKRYLVQKGGQDHGPFARDSLVGLARKGELGPAHTVLDTRTKDARAASEWPMLAPVLAEREREEEAERARAERQTRETRARWRRRATLAAYVTITVAALAALAFVAHDAGARTDLRVAGLGALYLLALAALVGWVERDGSQASEAAFHMERGERSTLVLGLVACASAAPALVLAPYVSLPPTSFGDDLGDALVAAELARSGLGRGWVAGPLAGFPLAVHEAALVPLLVRALVAVGLSPLGATHLLGTLGTLATPLAAYTAGVRAGVRPLFALAGALLCAWTSASTPYAGGLAGFFSSGLVGPALALPICLLAAGEIAGRAVRWSGALLAILAVLLDPPLLFATLLVLGAGGLASMTRDTPRAPLLGATLRAALASSTVAAGIHVHGLARLAVPFGPPTELAWRYQGAPPERLGPWILEGALLDDGRAPWLTYLTGAALLALAVQLRRPVARGALAAALTALAWPFLAHAVFDRSESPLATSALLLLRPVHALALLPPAAGAALAVALEQSAPRLEQMIDTLAGELDRVLAIGATLVLALGLGLALPDRLDAVTRLREGVLQRAEAPCGPLTPDGYDRAGIAAALRALEGGRLAYARDSLAVAQCAELDALALESAVPVATTSGAGAHVGAMWLAFARLEPARDGAAARAEALGVRHVLESADTVLPAPWARSEPVGGFVLSSLPPSVGLVGAGCITRTWHGSEDALRAHLGEVLATPEGADALLSPSELVALEASSGSFVESSVEGEACDARQATITERPREAGALEADVSSRAPIVLVFRVAAFPSWGVLVDGAEVTDVLRVAPGVLAIRLAPGRHHVAARVIGLPWRWPGLALATLLALLVAFATPEWLRRKTMPLTEREDPWRKRRGSSR